MMGSDAFDNLPIDIDTLAALVEGDLGCQEADVVLERLLQADPELAAQVEMMSRDRVMLRTLGDETPPAGLGESVLARLERDTLLDLRDTDNQPHALPISKVFPVKKSRWYFRRPVVGAIGVLAAAGLVIVAGIMLQLGSPSNPNPTHTPPTHMPLPPMAKADPPTTPTTPTTLAGNASAGTDQAAQPNLTSADPLAMHDFAHAGQTNITGPRVATDHPQLAAPDTKSIAALSDTATAATLATKTDDADLAAGDATELVKAEPIENHFFDDAARALALLDEGRLLIRVRSVVPLRTTNNLDHLVSRRSSSAQAWHLDRNVPPTVLASVDTMLTPGAIPEQTGPIVMANSQEPDPARSPAPDSSFPQSVRTQPSSTLVTLYLADTRHDSAALASLLAALSLGDGQRAFFDELPEPIHTPPVYTEESVLWWSRPPSQWVGRANVPVAVERIERD